MLVGTVLAQPIENTTQPQLLIEIPDGAKPWTSLNFNDRPGQFQFAIVTDRTGGHRPGIFENGVKKLNLLQPEFVMSVGDFIEGYTTDTTELNRQWDEFSGFVNQLDMPFFYVPGNHDLTNPVMEQIWKQRFGPTYYSFVYNDVLFMALNSEDQLRGAGNGSISAPQLDWIEQTLNKHRDVKWTILFMHQPLWAQQVDPVKWSDVERLLKARKHTVFVGHRHHYQKYERNNASYYMLATTGGSSPLRGPQFGEFDHFVWVTMTEQGPILANLHLDGILAEDFFTEQLAAYTSKIWSSNIIRVEPLYVEDDNFKSDSLRFRLTNSFDTPVSVKFSPGFSWDLKGDIASPESILPPNSVGFTAMTVESRKGKQLESLRPIKVKAEIAVHEEGKADFFVPLEFNVAPVRKYALTKTNKPVRVDGALDEWKSLPYTIATKEGARFGIHYDDSNIYLAVAVTDTEVISEAGTGTSNQDFVGFVIDGQPTATSAVDKGEGWFKNSLYFIASPADKSGTSSTSDMSEEEKSLSWKCIKTKGGYAFEVAVPLSYVQKQQGNNWQTVRVNVVVQDKDSSSSSPRVMWQTNWRDAGHVPGSGMFFKR
jgi:3',5'-cyclic AMP phosphodiesterase CpdA